MNRLPRTNYAMPLNAKLIADHSYRDNGRVVAEVRAVNPEITAANIAIMSHEACHDPMVVEVAKRIVINVIDENDNMFLSKLSEVNAVYNWVAKHIRYTRDPHNIELVFNPRHIFSIVEKEGRAAEDCDTISGVVATLLCALGHKCRITIAGFRKRPGFSHVFTEVLLPPVQKGQGFSWVVVDPSVGQHVNKMCSDITHSKSFAVGSLR